jgi:23S rRNA pseudouridine1911/1915/1917 synthase
LAAKHRSNKHRSLAIGRAEAGRTVAHLLETRFRLSRPEAKKLLRARQVRLGGVPCTDSNRRARLGQRLEVFVTPERKPHPAAVQPDTRRIQGGKQSGKAPAIVYSDAHIVVVNKPAGMTTVRHASEAAEFGARARRFLPPTLVDVLAGILGKGCRVRAVHRLDRETTGLVVLARTAAAERNLGVQFRQHSIERRYLAIVRGRARSERIESHLVRDRGDGRRGSDADSAPGQRAVTHVRVVEELGDFTLVECRLETGRTHQVRIHLGEHGTPLCGETVYDRPLHGSPAADTSGARRPALHAAFLAIDHPATGKRMNWSAPLPDDMDKLLRGLRKRASRSGDR